MLRKLKCGLEIHAQLNTTYKLFSLSPSSRPSRSAIQTSQIVKPNTRISFFDIGIPGTQPNLNKEALLYALKTAVALNCTIHPVSSFDRKHYFYGDQPLGYQITQHYHPIANNGYLNLSPRYDDGVSTEKKIHIQQIQIEQDTGKSLYKLATNIAQVDFNRGNTPLIEMVTDPDFSTVEEVKAFVKKLQNTLVSIGVCTGELETGAMRVDVNISVDDNARIELKNLPTTSAITHAIRYEYERQCEILDKGGKIDTVETRGWDGKKTVKLRSKESSVDYRYMPDPELPHVSLDVEDIVSNIKKSLPASCDDKLESLLSSPHNLKLRDASILIADPQLLEYYEELFKLTKPENLDGWKNPINWITHELVGDLSKLGISFDKTVLDVKVLAQLIKLVEDNNVSRNNAKLILLHLLSNPDDQLQSVESLAKEFDMFNESHEDSSELNENLLKVVQEVIAENPKAVNEIINQGKHGRVNFLLGKCMQATGRKIKATVLDDIIKRELGLKS